MIDVLYELVGYVLYAILYIIIVVGTFTTAKWLRERWRTRKDKGYDASKWGAF